MENDASSGGRAARFDCQNCGANMVFDAVAGKLVCAYCGGTREIAAGRDVAELDFNAFVSGGGALRPMATNALQISCDGCGAVVAFVPPETAGTCGFCGVRLIGQPKSADPLVAPQGVLPFRVTPAQSSGAYRAWLASRWFAPSALASMAKAGRLTSVYIPYWTFDAATESAYTGERGDHYEVIESHYSNGKWEQRSVRKTRWTSVQGSVERNFDDVCVAATKALPEEYVARLEPWDLEDLRSYEPAFLSGHKAQTYQVTLEEGRDRFRAIAANVIEGDVRESIGGDEQRIGDVSTIFSNVTFKHLLLPVYAGAYEFNGRVFQIVVNGRTGEVQGERPYSWVKILALVVFVAGLIALVAIAFGGR